MTWPAPNPDDLKLISHPEAQHCGAALWSHHDSGSDEPSTAAQMVIARHAVAVESS